LYDCQTARETIQNGSQFFTSMLTRPQGFDDLEAKEKEAGSEKPTSYTNTPLEMDTDTYPKAESDSGSTTGEAVNQNGKPKPGIRVIHPMIGGSVLDYADQPIDDKKTLIGNRYLCRGGGMFIVAPSGQGKSTLAVQMAAEWALGYSPIGLSARNEPLRTLIVQAEDDAGDVTEMSRWIRTSEMFSDDQLEQIDLNTHIEPCNDVTGDEFLGKLDSFIEQFGPDIVIANPYSSYLGGDVKDEKLANQFLRNGLTPLLVKHQCAIVWMHHTPKTQYSPSVDFTTTDFMYRGMGCATMTNWARAYLVFEPVPDNDSVFRFVAAKRGKRIGWGSFIRYFKHSDNGELRWIPVSTEEAEKLETAKKAGSHRKVIDLDKVFAMIPVAGEIERDLVIREIIEKFQVGKDRALDEIRLLEAQERVKSEQHYRDNSPNRGGRKPYFLSRIDPETEVKSSSL
jgi:AAA domain-containing protein